MRTASSMWSCVIKSIRVTVELCGWFRSYKQFSYYHWMSIMLPYWCPHDRTNYLEVYQSVVVKIRWNIVRQILNTRWKMRPFNSTWNDTPIQACFVPFRATSRSNNAIFCESKATLHLMSGHRTLVIFVLIMNVLLSVLLFLKLWWWCCGLVVGWGEFVVGFGQSRHS